MMDTVFASRLTTTRRVSSEVRAMVVERVGAAAARPTRPINTAASTIAKRILTPPSSRHRANDRTKVTGENLIPKVIYTSSGRRPEFVQPSLLLILEALIVSCCFFGLLAQNWLFSPRVGSRFSRRVWSSL